MRRAVPRCAVLLHAVLCCPGLCCGEGLGLPPSCVWAPPCCVLPFLVCRQRSPLPACRPMPSLRPMPAAAFATCLGLPALCAPIHAQPTLPILPRSAHSPQVCPGLPLTPLPCTTPCARGPPAGVLISSSSSLHPAPSRSHRSRQRSKQLRSRQPRSRQSSRRQRHRTVRASAAARLAAESLPTHA